MRTFSDLERLPYQHRQLKSLGERNGAIDYDDAVFGDARRAESELTAEIIAAVKQEFHDTSSLIIVFSITSSFANRKRLLCIEAEIFMVEDDHRLAHGLETF